MIMGGGGPDSVFSSGSGTSGSGSSGDDGDSEGNTPLPSSDTLLGEGDSSFSEGSTFAISSL